MCIKINGIIKHASLGAEDGHRSKFIALLSHKTDEISRSRFECNAGLVRPPTRNLIFKVIFTAVDKDIRF